MDRVRCIYGSDWTADCLIWCFLCCGAACVLLSELEASEMPKENLGDDGGFDDDLRREVSRQNRT